MAAPSQEHIDRLLGEVGADALVVLGASSREPDLVPFAGRSRLGECFVIAPRGRAPKLGFFSPLEREEAELSGLAVLDPEALEIGRAAREGASRGVVLAWALARGLLHGGLSRGKLALAGSYSSGYLEEAITQLRTEGWSFVSGNSLVLQLRKRKSRAEVAEIREVAGGTVRAFRRIAEILGGATSRDGELWWRGSRLRVSTLRREVALLFAALGLEEPEGNLLAPGREGAVPHNTGHDESVVREGVSLIVDLFPRRRMYADCTRTFCVGTPSERLLAAHRSVYEALELARSRVTVGTLGWELQTAVCEHLGAAGHATSLDQENLASGYVHGLGHGVGYELHEYPEFRRENTLADGGLEEGDVLTLEPGLYYPEESFAVRLEDLFYLDADGLECLTCLPYELDPRAWLADHP